MSKETAPRVTRMSCVVCGHIWMPRSEYPVMCPRCHSKDWDGVKHLTPAQFRRQQAGPKKTIAGVFNELRQRIKG